MKVNLLVSLLCLSSTLWAQTNEFSLDETYPIDREGTLILQTDDADVKITGTDRTDVHVNVYRKVTVKGLKFSDERFEVFVNHEGGDLVIKERTSGSGISMMGYMSEVYTIDIKTPKDINLDIRGDDDDYVIRNVDGSISLDIDDGDAELMGCDGKDFRFSFDDGDIKMDKGAGKLYSRGDDGNLRVDNADFYDIEARVDDGDIEIETSLAENGEYSFRANDADIVLTITGGGGDFNIHHDDTRVSYSRNFETLYDEEDETRLKLRNGSAKVKIRADDARIRLNDTAGL